MFFVKKSKVDISFNLVDKLVYSYFDYLRDNNIALTYKEISELFRYTICKLLDLETSCNSEELLVYSSDLRGTLSEVVDFDSLMNKSLDYRQGFLEACVHCMEMSRKKVVGG